MDANKPTTQNILHAFHFDLKERRFKLNQQRTKGVASIERHAVYSNVVHNTIGQIMITDIKAIPNWALNVDEVSNGVFLITLTDKEGRKAELTDFDSQHNIYRCIGYAFDIERQINKNWNKYLFDTIIFRIGDTRGLITEYNDKAFGSWTIELNNKRIILDGRDGLMTLQSRSDQDWKDEWETNCRLLTFDEVIQLINKVNV